MTWRQSGDQSRDLMSIRFIPDPSLSSIGAKSPIIRLHPKLLPKLILWTARTTLCVPLTDRPYDSSILSLKWRLNRITFATLRVQNTFSSAKMWDQPHLTMFGRNWRERSLTSQFISAYFFFIAHAHFRCNAFLALDEAIVSRARIVSGSDRRVGGKIG